MHNRRFPSHHILLQLALKLEKHLTVFSQSLYSLPYPQRCDVLLPLALVSSHGLGPSYEEDNHEALNYDTFLPRKSLTSMHHKCRVLLVDILVEGITQGQ